MKANTPVSFWISEGDEWKLIALAPGQSYSVEEGGDTEEGFSLSWEVYTHEGDHIQRESGSRGRDCDGPYSSHYLDCADLDRLHIHPLWLGWNDDHTDNIDPERKRPDWIEAKAWQHDGFAEAAGY